MVREKPPASPKVGEKKKRARSKSVKRAPNLSPFQERLKETDFYTKPKFDDFLSTAAVKDRLLLVHSLLSDDVTDITRAWPLQLKTKDSRLRRELSEQGKDCFVRGETDLVLGYYNKALLYSTGKGIAHTLARRAAFFLSTDDQNLAIRDLSVALEYGGLETELLDFLLVHHTQDEEKIKAKNEAAIDNAINTMKNAKLDMQNATASDISKWAEEIRVNLSKASKLRKNDPGSRKIKDDILKNIINSIKQASKETNLDENIEIDELEVPKLKEKNPLCPAFSEAARIAFDPEKGRIVKARRAIKAGEIICVDDPTCAMLNPDNKDSIYDHCLNCFRFTKAPLPCDNCCSVVFCSKKCKDLANQSFHKIECQLKIYEIFEHEGKEIFSLFMALRAVTQKPIQYFTENQKEIEKFLDLEEPTFPFPGRAYQSGDYRALCNLMTHVSDIDPDVAMKNSVLSVFFLRFIQKSGYFRQTGGSGKLRGDKSLGSTETFILRLIHQVICAQAYNSHSVHKITKTFQWEKIGNAINPSMALVNHSCDSNSVRCNVNKSSILVAARHIPEGEEITDTYYGHFRDTSKHQREYYTLKNYMFECECAACKENWPQEDEIPYELFRVPNFEQERIYKVRHGDKKDLVTEVIEVRRAVEKSMTYKRFSEALINYQALCAKLEEHLRRPHIYFLQARSGITHCVWNLYCTQFPEQPIEETEEDSEYGANRDHAKLIYQSNHSEQAVENNGLDLGPCGLDNTDEPVVDTEKAALLESTRKLLEQSSQKVQSAVTETQIQRDKFDQERIQAQEACNGAVVTTVQETNGHTETNGQTLTKVQDLVNKKQTKEEMEEKNKQRQFENEMREKEQKLRAEKKKQWEEEDNERLARESERKSRRELQCKENLKREKEKEEMKRKKKKVEEEEKVKLREQDYEKKKEIEKTKRQNQEADRQKMKKEEEDELQLLLMEIGDDFDIDATLDEVPIESYQNGHTPKENGTKPEQRNILNDSSSPTEKDIKFPFDTKTDQFEKKMTKKEEEVNELTQEISFTSMIASSTENDKSAIPTSNLSLLENSLPNKEPSNVWSSLRKIKESETDYATIFNSKTDKTTEIVSMGDIDDMIKDLALQIADKRTVKKPVQEDIMIKADLTSITEDNEENEEVEKDTVLKENTVIINNTGIQKNIKPFNFEVWKSEMDAMFEQPGDPLEKKASDELYLKNLRQKIQVSVEKVNKENKNKDKAKDRRVEKTDVNKSPPPSKVDDFGILKLKEKERKKKKQDVKFQQKVVDNADKMKEMSIKTKKIEKISLESQEEIQKIRDMAKKLIAKSEAKENEFNEIFLNLDNLDNFAIESEKKRGKKGKNKIETVQPSTEDEVHWTEVENNKWVSHEKGVSKVTNVLAALRAAAENGQSNFVAESLKETISNCKKMEKEDEEEKKGEKIRKIEEEKQRLEEDMRNKNNKENEERKKKEIEKEQQQKAEDEKRVKAEQKKERLKNESDMKLQAEKKLAEEKLAQEEKVKMEAYEKEFRIQKEKEKRCKEREQKEEVEKKQKENNRLNEEKKKAEAFETKQRLEKEKEAELDRNNKSMDKQKAWEEKEKQRMEKEEVLKRIAEEERLQRQEEYLEKMKLEEERRKKEMIAKMDEERKIQEEQKANELKALEIKRVREEECRKKEKERKLIAEKKLKEKVRKQKLEEEMKIKEEKDRKDKEVRALQEEREKIERLWEEKKRVEKEEEIQKTKQEDEIQIKQDKERKFREEEEERKLRVEKQRKENEERVLREERGKSKKSNDDQCRLEKEKMKKIYEEKTHEKERKQTTNVGKRLGQNDSIEDASITRETKLEKSMDTMRVEEEKLKKLSEEMKKMEEAAPRIESKPPTQKQYKLPKPVSEKVPILKETQTVKNSKPATVVTVDSNSFMPKKNTKSEVQILKIGSPSQIRKAVMCEVKVEEPLERVDHKEVDGTGTNYQISKIPTTIFEFKKPTPKPEPSKNYAISKVPTTNANIEMEKMSKTYVENVVKYSETKPIRKRSDSVPRPPPPSFKPPPPPPIF